MASIYDIVYDYIDTFYPNEKMNKEQKKTIHREVKKLLQNGWCSSELYMGFKDASKKKAKPTLNATQLFRGKRRKKENLIEPGTFYYHNDLRLTSAPPKREIDYDSGEIKVINEEYFLEMKASYTVDDLIKYYSRQTGVKLPAYEQKRYIGTFNWLVGVYGVEMVLFMIDITVNMYMADDQPMPYSPLDIQKYKREAKQIRDQKITENVHSGGNKIVRKKRLRSNRNRRSTSVG
jgi:hypothetical protein